MASRNRREPVNVGPRGKGQDRPIGREQMKKAVMGDSSRAERIRRRLLTKRSP